MSDNASIKKVSPLSEEIAAIESQARLRAQTSDSEREVQSIKARVESILRNRQVIDKRSDLWKSVKRCNLEMWVYSLAHQLLIEEGISPRDEVDVSNDGGVGFW